MGLRKGHGTGAGVPRIEVLPPDELPPASPAHAEPPQRSADGRFLPGNRVGQAQRCRPSVRGAAGLDRAAPEYRTFQRWGQRYAAHRRRELAQLHGGHVSAGVGAIVESAALAMAAARYLQERASRECSADLFRQASQLAATARQHELAAWELAAREAQSRPQEERPFWLRGKGENE